jgi:DnaJ-class molecular chaperone
MEKRYNKFLRNYVTINEGEQFCPKCDGKGKVPRVKSHFGLSGMLICDKCLGDGKIDWVEKVVGKKRNIVYGYEHAIK